MYMYDGQAMWDTIWSEPGYISGPYDLNAARLADLTRLGRVGELILVAVDVVGTDVDSVNRNRERDYVPPEDSTDGVPGQADKFADFLIHELKEHIDSHYRTLPDAEHTFSSGVSLGGTVSMYLGWDFTDSFSRVGSVSGSFWRGNFGNRLLREPKRDIRVYLDSGEDNYGWNLSLRDNFIGKSPPYVLGGDLRYIYGIGHVHEYPDFGKRLHHIFEFLYPATEEPNDFLVRFQRADVNADNTHDIADAIFTLSYLFAGGPSPSCLDAADTNDDGEVDIADAIAVLSHLFAGSGDLPEPFGECGEDPTPEDPELGCESFPACDGE
jgi:hypothetical protein